ncbi:ATP synthase regulation protein NCA2-domain-containing protein [Coemansia spiralis]|nr:ATP synthase regulation protein NCA2-domain-containing protein [Coemansia spiralis]
MSFVDEHYTTVFRALARNAQSQLGERTPESVARMDDAAADTKDAVRDILTKRAFDLSTQLLAASSNEQKLEDVSFETRNTSGYEETDANNNKAASSTYRYTNSIGSSRPPCPSMTTVINDIQLVQQSSMSRKSTTVSSQQKQDVLLVLLSSVAAIHAHTIEKLLESALPLSVDMEYWSTQGSNSLLLATYFIQSLPRRLYRWSIHTLQPLFRKTMNSSYSGVLAQIYAAMPDKLLFPDMEIFTTSLYGRHTKQSALGLFRVPDKINVMSLTQREIRHNQMQIATVQEELAIKIGELSQAVFAMSCSQSLDASDATTPNTLLQQIERILKSTNEAGRLQDSYSISLNKDSSMNEIAQTAETQALRINAIPAAIAKRIEKYRRPSTLVRCWLPAVAMLFGAKYLSSYIYGHREDFKEWLASGLVTLRNYILQYILQPLRSGYETIRYGKHTYNVVTQESLQSDFNSLEDMVVGFAKRFGNVDPVEIRQRVENGDLSDVMRVYSQEMQQPFRNAVFGDLVQAILIQIQKVKVDVGQTMAALDKLLKSNELNFLLLSTVPATLTIYATTSWIVNGLSWWIGGANRNTVTSIQVIVRDIDRLLNTNSENAKVQPSIRLPADSFSSKAAAAAQGRLIYLTYYLRYHAQHLPDSASTGRLKTGAGWSHVLPHTRSMFLEDVRDIESVSLNNRQKRAVIERMYRNFRFL